MIQAFERPEQRSLLGGPPGGPEQQLERFEPGEYTYQQPGYMQELFAGEQIAPHVDPEEYRVLLNWKEREEAIREKQKDLPWWLADPYGVDPLGIGRGIAELQVSVPAMLKMWEAVTHRAPALRTGEQIAAVAFQLLQEPALALEEGTGATSVMMRPESRDLKVEQWYRLTVVLSLPASALAIALFARRENWRAWLQIVFVALGTALLFISFVYLSWKLAKWKANWLYVLAVATLILAPWLRARQEARTLLFPLLALAIALMASSFTPTGLLFTHLAILVPWPILVVALA